ncbi:MAG TPA: peptidoglycan endopeptidase [Mycobacterium sp.]
MFALVTLVSLLNQVSGTPYISGGDSPAGTDCSGLASWVSNIATGRPAFGDRFHTANEESALLARGFQYGAQPGALVIGWNSYHTAVTLPDGTPVSSGERGGVKVGGGGAYQSQFTRHMYLPVSQEMLDGVDPALPADEAPVPVDGPPPPDAPPAPDTPPPPVEAPAPDAPAPIDAPPAPDAPAPPVESPAPVDAPATDAPAPPEPAVVVDEHVQAT